MVDRLKKEKRTYVAVDASTGELIIVKSKAHPPCSECRKPMKPIWKDDPTDNDTWFFHNCEICSEDFCDNCIEAMDEDEGLEICLTCYSEWKRKDVHVSYGRFFNTMAKSWTVMISGEFLKHEDGWGHKRIRTFKTKDAALKAAINAMREVVK